MAKIIALAYGNSALSIALTGVSVEELASQSSVEERLRDLLTSDYDIVIVDEHWRNNFSEWMQLHLGRHKGAPLVIFCPSFSEEDPGTDAYINAIVKPAVGFEIRLD